MKDKISAIYIFINKINNMMYVGKTEDFYERIKTGHLKLIKYKYKSSYRQKSYLHNAIKKYGLNNFKIYFFKCPTNKLSFFEELLIRELNTLAPNGYNLTTGGDGGKLCDKTKQKISASLIKYYKTHDSFTKGKKLSQEHIEKLRQCHIGKKQSEETKSKRSMTLTGHITKEETKIKISKALIGNKNGENPSYESIERRRLKMTGHKVSNETKKKIGLANGKSVICLETSIIYQSASEAGRILNINNSKISACCNGKRKTAGRLHWEYYIEEQVA